MRNIDKYHYFKRLLFLLPKFIRYKIFNIKILKLYQTSTGNYYLPMFAFKDTIRNHIINNQIFDVKIYNLAKRFIKKNSIVIDAGANYGQLSILFSKQDPSVKVYAFEAYKYIYEILCKNIDLNNCNIKAFNCILGNTKIKKVFLSKSKLDANSTYGSNEIILEKYESNSDAVQAIQIDDLNIFEEVSFMKIDVQGYDLKVLEGAKKTILKNKMPIIIEYSSQYEKTFNYKFDDFRKILKKINYKIDHKIDDENYLIISET